IVRAPGRVNLIGEHTDYNEGLVFPAAIGLETWICFLPTDDRTVELTRLDTNERAGFDLDDLGPPRDTWIDYVAGTAWALAERNVPLRGLRGVIASTIPIGSGLSSSAAIELASAWALSERRPPLDGMALAQAAQRAENEFVGVRSGLMDQFASSLGRRGAALVLDCRSLDYHPVRLPADEFVLVACDTRSPRRLEASEYNARRAQCERAVELLARRDPAIRALRDVDMAMLESLRDVLDEETFRRCEHVVRENQRVLAFERALVAGDLSEVGRIMAEGHASLRDLYEVSSRELDALVEIMSGVEGVVGARMTGGGFGGCTVNLVARDAVDRARDAVAREYERRTGLQAGFYVVEPVDGAGPLDD
ncbi:MAG: galactokinase, partial [Chloroflexota bacterium]|nr:galactokinase [Chloroflexota bacterium]